MTAPTDVTFSAGTKITSQWLNGVNDHVNNLEADPHPEYVNEVALAMSTGASLVGYGDQTVDEALDERLPEIGTYVLLRAYTGPITAFFVRGVANIFDGGFGVFRVDVSDTTTADNGGTVLVDASGRRWKRDFFGRPNASWFGGDGAAIVSALSAHASVSVPSGTYAVTTSEFSGDIEFLPGAVLDITGTLTISGRFSGAPGCFSGSGTIVFASGAVNYIDPEWWGKNTVPGVTDMSPAYQKAVGCASASTINSIKVRGNNKFVSTVTVTTLYQSIRFFSDAMASYSAPGTYDGEITGADGLDSLFLLSTKEYALEFDHVRFVSSSKTTGVKCAIKSTAQAGPARPINIQNCSFVRFDKAIWSVLSPSGTQTGMCQLNIRKNSFISGNYALYAEGKTGAIMNLDFSGNVSEVGGSIRILDYGATGTLKISDNLLEAQADAIYITGKALTAEISRNYFEGNTGYLIYFDGFSTSELTTKDNYISTSSSAKVTVKNAKHTNSDRYFSTTVKYHPSFLNKNSDTRVGYFFLEDANIAGVANTVSKETASISPGSLYLSYVPTYLKVGDGTRFERLPYGSNSIRGVATITTESPLYTVNTGLAAGQFVIGFMTLIKTSSANPWVNIELYDNADVKIGEIGASTFYPFYSAFDRLIPVVFAVRATAGSTGVYKVKVTTETGVSFDLTDIFVQRGTFTTTSAISMSDGYPTTKSGVATIPAGATSVVVTHSTTGYGYTPYGVRATPAGNVGSVWVDTVTDTQFTIWCSAAPAGDTKVYWDMF